MNLDKIFRNAVKTIRNITISAHVPITHKMWTGQDAYGVITFGTVRTPLVVWESHDMLVQTTDGKMVTAHHKVTFTEPVAPVNATGRHNPIDPRDELILANGVTGPILKIGPVAVDPTNKRPYFHEVWLG